MQEEEKSNKSELLSQLKIERDHESKQVPSTYAAWKWTTIGIVSVIVIVIFFSFIFKAEPGEHDQIVEANDSVKVATSVTVEMTDSDRAPVDESSATLNASGYIAARRVATVSAQILGLIREVNVEEGMAVEEGQVLARLDATVAQINLDLARAQVRVQEARLNSIRADLDEAQRVKQRINGLTSGSFASEADITLAQANVDKALSAMATVKADIEVAQINVRQQRASYDKHTIRAPFSGVVTGKNAQPGEIVSPSSAGGGFTRTGICTIVDMTSLEIEVDVNESFIRRVFSGQKVLANLDAYPQWDIPASVIAVIPAANRAKATVRVRIKLELQDEKILPDMGVKVAFFNE